MGETTATRPVLEALAGALLLAAACTLGDYLWVWIPRPHPWWMGVLHGVGMFALVGGWMGLCAGERRRALQGVAAAVTVSALLSGSFYLLYRPLGVRPTMVLLWVLLWLLFGLLDSWLGARGLAQSLGQRDKRPASAGKETVFVLPPQPTEPLRRLAIFYAVPIALRNVAVDADRDNPKIAISRHPKSASHKREDVRRATRVQRFDFNYK